MRSNQPRQPLLGSLQALKQSLFPQPEVSLTVSSLQMKRGSARASHAPKATQLLDKQAGIQSQFSLTPNSFLKNNDSNS